MRTIITLEKLVGVGIITAGIMAGYAIRGIETDKLKTENAKLNIKYEQTLQHHYDFVNRLPNVGEARDGLGSLSEEELLNDLAYRYKLGIEYELSNFNNKKK